MAAGVEAPQAFTILAMMGRLRDAPPEAFTEQTLLRTESDGFNALHHAGRNGDLNILPLTFRTHRYFSIPNDYGRTVYHYAAEDGHLDQIPKELLTEENLMAPDRWGYCALQLAADHGHLQQIPLELATPEKLTIAAAQRKRIFDIRKS